MIDADKLDSYFENNRTFGFERSDVRRHTTDWRRLFKILLPCLAAGLLGLVIIIPNIRKNVDLSDNITLPRKNEMEKLHIEQTVFNTVDSKNRVNKIVADSVDEVDAGSQVYEIMHPKAVLPTDRGQTVITSQKGYFNQNKNILELETEVKAVIDDDTEVTTSKATYDFNSEKGWGKEHVKAVGNWGNMLAEGFSYDKSAQILVLKGNNSINTSGGVLVAEKETRIYQQKNKSVSVGNAVITQDDNKLYAEEVVGWFTQSSKKELERAEAYRNVRMITPKEIITGGEAYYDAKTGKIDIYGAGRQRSIAGKYVNIIQGQNKLRALTVTAYVSTDGRRELQKAVAIGDVLIKTPDESIAGARGVYEVKTGKITVWGGKRPVVIKKEENVLYAQKVEAFLEGGRNLKYAVATGEVEIVTPKGSAWGERGIYSPTENKIELFENVRLEQNGNFIAGAHAITDLETSVSRISGDETTGGRIRGTFYKKRK